MTNERVSKETKLNVTKDIVVAYLKSGQGEETQGPALKPEEVCALFKEIYAAVDSTVPEPETRKVGLG
jgi:hypothetical protein